MPYSVLSIFRLSILHVLIYTHSAIGYETWKTECSEENHGRPDCGSSTTIVQCLPYKYEQPVKWYWIQIGGCLGKETCYTYTDNNYSESNPLYHAAGCQVPNYPPSNGHWISSKLIYGKFAERHISPSYKSLSCSETKLSAMCIQNYWYGIFCCRHGWTLSQWIVLVCICIYCRYSKWHYALWIMSFPCFCWHDLVRLNTWIDSAHLTTAAHCSRGYILECIFCCHYVYNLEAKHENLERFCMSLSAGLIWSLWR